VISGNLLQFAVAWMAVSLCLHPLLVFYPERPGALLAARKKFIFSRLGDLCLLGAIGLIYVEFHTWDFQVLFERARAAAGEGKDYGVIGFLLVLCALLKSAQFPFHSWLPDTMETPTPVSALMHAGIINAGGFLILRLSPLVVLSPGAMLLLVVVGGFTALFASLTMLTHASVKRALAFSTVAQMGFMMLECGLGAFSLAVLHLTAHSLYKAHAFLSSGSVVEVSRSAWVPDARPRAHPFVIGGTLLTSALLTYGSATVLGVDLGKSPGSFFLGLVFGLSLAYLLWNLWGRSLGPAMVVWGLALGMIVSLAGFALHRLFEWGLASALPQGPVDWSGANLALMAFPFLLFLLVLVFQAQLPVWSSHSLAKAFYVHARNGFYFTTLANRWVAALGPLRREAPIRQATGDLE
jgi:NAD(P)H-quinone oxidoreductase subunit 5